MTNMSNVSREALNLESVANTISKTIEEDAQQMRQVTNYTGVPEGTQFVYNNGENVEKHIPLYEKDTRFLNPHMELPPIQVRCKMGGRGTFPLRGIVAISGKQKRGKSMSIYAVAIPLVSGKPFGNIVPQERARRMIVFDTEMDKAILQRRQWSMRRAVGEEYCDNFLVCPLIDVPRNERMKYIIDVVEEHDPDIIVIDVLSDLMLDVNDSRECLDDVMKLAASRTVFCTMHENKADANIRGHLGSQLSFKSTENYNMDCENGEFTLSIRESRITCTDDAEPLVFRIDANGNITAVESSSAEMREQRQAKLRRLFEEIFGNSEQLCHTDVKERLMEKGHREREARHLMTEAQKLGIIEKLGEKGSKAPYRLTPVAS